MCVRVYISLQLLLNENFKAEKDVSFKNNVPFRSCISKINHTLKGNAKDLDTIMSMHNVLEYSQNCSVTSGKLWNYYRNKIDDVMLMLQLINQLSIEENLQEIQELDLEIKEMQIDHHGQL